MNDNFLNLRTVPQDILDIMSHLILNRQGKDAAAYMLTRDLIGYIDPHNVYELVKVKASILEGELYAYHGHDFTFQVHSAPGAIPTFPYTGEKNRMQCYRDPNNKTPPPPHGHLTGTWSKHEAIAKNNANLLGGFGIFTDTNHGKIEVPVITATNENLAFYGSYLVGVGDSIKFETHKKIPIGIIGTGKTYVEKYVLMEGLGDAEYLEYHNQPHFWMPMTPECSGHLLFAREMNGEYFITGFKIPFGYGVYMSPYVIHADSFLVGEFIVAFTIASEYSTVLLENKKDVPIKLHFYDA